MIDGVREVGGAHNSDDEEDNITFSKSRGTTSGKFFRERSIFGLETSLQTKSKKPVTRITVAGDEESVQDFQRKIYQKAKQEPEFQFYVLYDKVRSMKFLRVAYKQVKRNGGAPGIDNMTFEDIESKGLEQYLKEIQKELETFTYKPSPVKRVYIPKENGKKRPLGIPTIKDRIVQMSCKLVIEYIFEADFEDSSYGFRPDKSAQDAIKQIKLNLGKGMTEIYDADLSSYFDTIPHDKLMITIAQRISDKNVLHLIKMWLKAPVWERDEETKQETIKKNKVGTPQGGVISPLLANIYMHLIDRVVNSVNKIFYQNGIKIVRYADDFVLMGKRITKDAIDKLKSLLERMGLKLNEDKTKLVNAKEEGFNFLGFTIDYAHDKFGRNCKYWNIRPSQKAIKKIKKNIRTYLKTHRTDNPFDIERELRKKVQGWMNYYTIKGVSYLRIAKGQLRKYLVFMIKNHLERRSQRKRSASVCYRAANYVTKQVMKTPTAYN